jgi:hypothetical protein
MSYWCSQTFVTFSSRDRSSCSSSRRSEWVFCLSDALWRSCCSVWSSHSDSSRRLSSSLSAFLSDSQNQIWKSTKKRWFLSNLDACDWLFSARAEDQRSLIERETWKSSSSNSQRSSRRVSWASSFDFSLDVDEVVSHAREEWYSAHWKIKWSLLSRRALIMFWKTYWYQKIEKKISKTMIWLESVCELRFMWLFQKFDLELKLCFSELIDVKWIMSRSHRRHNNRNVSSIKNAASI